MRTRNDRLRHAIGFELIGLLIAAPLASWVTGVGLNHMGPLALFFSVLATVWNYVYNIGVDKLLMKYQGHTHKSLWQRIVHTFGFEGGLLTVACGDVLVAGHQPAGGAGAGSGFRSLLSGLRLRLQLGL